MFALVLSVLFVCKTAIFERSLRFVLFSLFNNDGGAAFFADYSFMGCDEFLFAGVFRWFFCIHSRVTVCKPPEAMNNQWIIQKLSSIHLLRLASCWICFETGSYQRYINQKPKLENLHLKLFKAPYRQSELIQKSIWITKSQSTFE